MNTILKIFLSMSFSGSLLILVLLLGNRFLKDKISRQWQYYIWLVVVFRLLLPFGPETNLLGKAYQVVDRLITRTDLPPQYQPPRNIPESTLTPVVGLEPNKENANSPAEDQMTAHPLQDISALLTEHIWLIWLAAALGMLIRKLTIYQGFIRYIKAGLNPVSDIEMLDQLSVAAEQAGIQKPVELCVNPLISSPLLIGFFHPCIVLPSADISEKDFPYIVLHELTHYKRRDMFYKWLVQVTVCLHWFNPFVHLMSRKITKACEFSCDEAVLAKIGSDKAQDYGKTLLNAMAAVGRYKENLGAVTLSENKQLLKERIGAIMNFKKKPASIRFLTGVLTLCIIFGAAFVGVYPVAAASNQSSDKSAVSGNKDSVQGETDMQSGDYASQAERYYKADSLPLFEIAFSRLDESAQRKWLKKLYANDDFAFFSAAVRGLGANSSLLADFAEKAYVDDEIAFFSTMTDCMDKTELESWLDQALKDGKWNFQSMLFNKLDRDDEFDKLEEKREKEWAEAQMAEYQAAGVTMDGKNYYYQEQLVNIFLDMRASKSFYTLDINPAGSVNIKIIRDADNKITGVAYMTDAEVVNLLDDMDDDDWLGDLDNEDWSDDMDDDDDRLDDLDEDDWLDDKDHDDDWLKDLDEDNWSDNMDDDDDWPDDMDDDDLPDDMDDIDDWQEVFGGRVWHPQVFPVNLESVADKEIVWLGEFTLSEGDRIWYDVSAETGNGLQIGFASPDDEFLNTTYYSVRNLRQKDETLRCTASFTFRPPVKPGTYKLFLRATDGALENVKGSVSIGFSTWGSAQ